ncbi:NAD(P)H-quinone oxidoreductase [Sphingomonas sp. Root50]|nr:NAD(P)H-quinone oxidoreductase [Sphingomonas sp. Root1294]KQY66635.1 NAD(P)H-quinone oxidoreductase [Sphingomonas sp. Root50]KRB90041.1 NAD(P)H-quinone oxidoreductase [Sphingomonas sp. Root720]
MRAVGIRGGKGGLDALYMQDLPVPVPGPGEILVKIMSVGMNRADIAQREGHYPMPPGISDVLGLEVGGVVAALGDGARRWKIGDRVCALLGGGGYAEYVAVDERHVLPVPDWMDPAEAGALPETIFTVYANVFERGRLAPGETLLIHGGNSGIGVTSILLAKAMGARTIATVRGPEKAAKTRALGANLVIDVTAEDFEAVVTSDGGADVILDMVGEPYFDRNIAALKLDGRICFISAQAGMSARLDFMPLLLKRLTVTGSTLRARSADEKARLARAIERDVWPAITDGSIRMPIDRRFALADVADAHAWLEAGGQFGKVVLIP